MAIKMEAVEEIVKIGVKGQIILPEKIREKEGLQIWYLMKKLPIHIV
jgi:hypothetical protein|uniref:SpoVT-AbrB domain-containing protein n=1 Tax=Candidatus Methanophaga sp. ANME-1 ERB7 TaxID=2759913 RepID=A0A7G9Z563_9EURY|nr:hypothetical protein BNGNOALE_00023 [Methanosarcinales archaeon ANME-1 ERB7]